MFQFGEPRDDYRTFRAENGADALGLLIQSIRWYAVRASHVLYTWCLFSALESKEAHEMSAKPMPEDAKFVLRRTLLNGLVLELRALHDRDKSSLGSCQIGRRLADPDTRLAFNAYLEVHSTAMPDAAQRLSYLVYLEKYCRIMAPPAGIASVPAHRLFEKMELVRRMANKGVAHSTLDHFSLYPSDFTDCVVASLTLACAVEACMGDFAVKHDYGRIEELGYAAAEHILHAEFDPDVWVIKAIRKFLPRWVEGGGEFPRFPEDLLPKQYLVIPLKQ
ncbi:hypothetical protein [Pseudoxanthomonas sp. PXM02]|uniref:hypothetical protein n=1 Tax=Pseudoxanthomonas sp. PXM02 TaxID=2769294 RepID=UPI0017854281|nr:hypothetical protein [Pseudoxanthomonas sp. PXM02]MBD9477743.1 hypothetical protein [Pseudoxanthomonas sp. PXM02]